MLSSTAHKHLNRQTRRVRQRLNNDELLRRAAYLPELDKLLLEQVLSHGVAVKSLARIHRTSPTKLRQRLRRLRTSLADPCFLFTTHFAHRLPPDIRPIARSHFVDQLTQRQCAARHHTSLHRVREALAVVRSLLTLAREHNATSFHRRERGERGDEEEENPG